MSQGTRGAKAVKFHVNAGWWLCAIGLAVVPIGVILVLAILVLADVLQRASDLQADPSLTV
jgi:hypothetical protein